MSLKNLSNNIQSESELHTFVKSERVIRRQLQLDIRQLEHLAYIINTHKHEEARKSNVNDYPLVNTVCEKAIDIIRTATIQDQKGTLEKFFTFDCWGAIYEQYHHTKPHTHGPALWSWCYYLQVPENAPPLYFREAKLKVYPKPDEIIIFPGHVTHEVPKANEMIGERIILAGNIYLDYRYNS